MKTRIIFLVAFILVTSLFQNQTFAHCDTMDGPLILDAQKSLETKDPNYFLIWVQKKDEAIMLEEFNKTLSLRQANPENSENIDTAFLEKLVQIHREGEGAEYTGLKPAGSITNPVVILGDKSFETKDSTELEKYFAQTITDEIKHRFQEVIEKQNYAKEDVDAGREYIAEYITFLHWAEGVEEMIKKKITHHVENAGSEAHDAHMEEILKNTYEVHKEEIKSESHTEELSKDAIYKIIFILFIGIFIGIFGTVLFRRK